MTCPACDTQNRPGARTCRSCAAPLPPTCAACGTRVREGIDLCPGCRTEPLPETLDDALDDALDSDGKDEPPGDGTEELDDLLELEEEPSGPHGMRLAADPLDDLSDPGERDRHEGGGHRGGPGDGGDDDDDDGERGGDEFHPDPAFVGRADLVERLEALVTRAVDERRLHFAALLGAPGSGKSRLARELGRRIRTDLPAAHVLVGVCGGQNGGAGRPFAAWARMLSHRLGLRADDSDAVAQDKIARGVEAVLPGARAHEVTHLLAHLIGHPFVDSPVVEPLADAPPKLEARLFIAVRRFLAAEAERGPLLVLLDDVERASPETVNLTHYLAAGLESLPVVLLAVGRPQLFDAHPSFGEGEVPLERFELAPLPPDEAEALLGELCRPAGAPPRKVVRHVRERMDGMPRALFELVRWLHESGAIVRAPSPAAPTSAGDTAHAGGSALPAPRFRFVDPPPGPASLPVTLEELLAARLRAMHPAERDLLEKAATCGEAFWVDALVALLRAQKTGPDAPDGPSLAEIGEIGDRTRDQVKAALLMLERRGLVVASPHPGIPGEDEYRFAYPPWWDVIYDGVPTDARRRYHRLIAQWLELRPEGRDEERQEEVGRHLERGGDGAGAAQRYRRAADAARARYYNDKAIRLYVQALQCLKSDEIATRIQLWHDLGSVYQMKGEHESALGAFERMLRLTWVVASRTKGAVALNKMGRVYRQKGDLDLALEYLERGHELFVQVGDERGVAGSLDDIGQVQWLHGRYDAALDRSAAALEMRRRLGDKRSVAVSLLNIGHIERHRGLFDEAAACYREALELRRALNDRPGIASTLNGLGVLSFQRGDLDGARREWEEALGIAEDIGASPQCAILEAHLAELALALGNRSDARTRFQRSERLATESDDRRLLSEATRQLGLIALKDGDREHASLLCARAHDLAVAAGIPVNVGRALVALGEVHAATLFDDAQAGSEKAEDFFQRGVDEFRRIGNEAELGAALERFGTYQVERGDLDAGRALLTEAQEIFSRLGMRAGDAVRRMITELA